MPRLLAFALVLLAGCTSRLRVRAANEFGCPESQVTVEGIGAGGYRATGCGQSAVYVCGRDGCMRQGPVESTRGDAPIASAPVTTGEPSAGGVKMTAIEQDEVGFEVPAWFNLDEDASPPVYRDSARHHAVRLAVEASTQTAEEWIAAHHANAERWTEELAGGTVHCATRVGSKLRLSVAVVASGTKVYELACTSDDVTKSKPDLTCTTVLRSLRLRTAVKPAGKTI